jgi:hypothetical protein
MTRKDSEKDSDRPHYYSQFWLDVAAGRKVIGASKTNEEAETAEPEPMESATARKPGRASVQPVADGRRDIYSPDVLEPEDVAEEEEEEIIEPEVEEEDLEQEEELNDQDLPNIVVDEEIPDMAIEQEPEPEPEPDISLEEVDEDIFDEEEEEEEEPWAAGRGRKKPKPGRQTKQPKRPIKRERRPGY